MESEDGLDDQDVVLLSLGLMLIIVGLLYLFQIVPSHAQYGGPPMWDTGPDRSLERYDFPPCNPRYNPECGRFRWEGPRARRWRWDNYPMMPDAPRGFPGAPYEGPPRW